MHACVLQSWCQAPPGWSWWSSGLSQCDFFLEEGGFVELFTSPIGWGLWFCRRARGCCSVCPLRLNRETCPQAALLFLDGSSLVSASPPSPDQRLLEPALRSSAEILEAEGGLYPQNKKLGTGKGFCAQKPLKTLLSFKGDIRIRPEAQHCLCPWNCCPHLIWQRVRLDVRATDELSLKVGLRSSIVSPRF